MKKTRIVCTIGPASSQRYGTSPGSSEGGCLRAMMTAGMNVARLNFSHGSYDAHGRVISDIRRTSSDMGLPVAILQDLCGPKIRVGAIGCGAAILKAGAAFTLTRRDVAGDASEVSLAYKSLPGDVRPGDPILLNDGAIEMEVVRVGRDDVECRVVVGGTLTSHKGINLPTRSVNTPFFTEKDREDLEFGLDQGVDFVALSFVRSVADVALARETMRDRGVTVPIIAKIEKHEALEHIDDIIRAVDGIMVARGDLGVEIPIELIPGIQKMLIRKANAAGKPVITATQMLKSMTDQARPTRAEVTDVANAILDGSDAVMLSEETAVGRYPVATVEMMSRIAGDAEEHFPYDEWASRFESVGNLSSQEAVARAACRMADATGAAAIVVCTQSGSTTALVAKYRPRRPLLSMTPDKTTLVRSVLTWGACPMLMRPSDDADEMEKQALRLALESGVVGKGDTVVITAGLPLHVPGTTNVIRVAKAG